ncbi:50S ribosome-binding GTPase [Microdochium nivale]|nr:50S ribosome-binding GTPase [Microdochium nivale]
MGMTGAGKSTFISHATDQKVDVGHGLTSCTYDPFSRPPEWQQLGPTWISPGTHEIAIYPSKSDPGLYLVDTPGFDDD